MKKTLTTFCLLFLSLFSASAFAQAPEKADVQAVQPTSKQVSSLLYQGGTGDGYASKSLVLALPPPEASEVQVYPSQLAKGENLRILATGIRTKVELEVMDLQGKLVFRDVQWPDSKRHLWTLESTQWPATTLLIRTVVDGHVLLRKVVVR